MRVVQIKLNTGLFEISCLISHAKSLRRQLFDFQNFDSSMESFFFV